jgi:hypothetical protein
MTLYPNLAEARATAAWVYYRLGRHDDAEKTLRAGPSSGPLSSDGGYFMARVLAGGSGVDQTHGLVDRSAPKRLLDQALKTKGGFAFRKEAEELLNQLGK